MKLRWLVATYIPGYFLQRYTEPLARDRWLQRIFIHRYIFVQISRYRDRLERCAIDQWLAGYQVIMR